MNLRTELIRIAKEHPETRKHLLPLLASETKQGTYRPPSGATWSGKIAWILADICDGQITTAEDMQKALSYMLSAVKNLVADSDILPSNSPEVEAASVRDLSEQFKRDMKKFLKPAL